MRKKLISLCVIEILVWSIFGCSQTVENTPAVEPKLVKAENTEKEDEEEPDTADAESESEGTVIFEAEYGQSEEQAKSITDEPEEETVVGVDSISQLDIDGRTPEETNLIKGILSEHEEEFEAFLMEDWEYPHIQWWVEVYGYDFTGDGEEEIIVSKCDVLASQTVSYNYVYDRESNKLLKFVGQDPWGAKIINGWDGEGTFLIYNSSTHVAHIYADIYTEIKWENGVLDEQVKLIEFDTRDSREMVEGKEGYYIVKNLTKEEEEKLLEGVDGIFDLTETKEYVWEDKDLDEYKQLFDTAETDKFSLIDSFFYSEENGFVKY